MTEQIQEKPHYIKGFDAVAHDTMIRRMAFQVIESNQSSKETVNKHVSAFKEKLKAHKKERNQFEKTISKAKQLAVLAAKINQNNQVVGC